jgi:DNA-directed RNA polymerase subunit RPC12/RpoP
VTDAPTVTCPRCGGPIYPDLAAVRDLANVGLRGGRLHCRAGCFDVWLRTTAPTPEPEVVRETRGKYHRPTRWLVCTRCREEFSTRGGRSTRCKSCQQAVQRERDKLRFARLQERRHRERRRAGVAS